MSANKKIIVIGGLSAGPSAAAKARRMDEEAEIILFEKTAHISYATCGIPYALSGKIKDRDKLIVVNPELLRDRFKVDVRLEEPVTQINAVDKTVTTNKGTYAYDKLVFATGGTAVVPPIKGLANSDNWAHAKTLEDFDKIVKSEAVVHSNHVTIIGAGLIGLETAENLIDAGKSVTVVELGEQILPLFDPKFSTMAQRAMEEKGVDFKLGVAAESFSEGRVLLSNALELETDFLIVSAGVKPNTDLLRNIGAKTAANGSVLVNEQMETSLTDIYAAGDCASLPNIITGDHGWYPMGTHSNKGGRTAGANAVGGNETFKGAYATAIMQAFDYTIGRTGMNGKMLKLKDIGYDSTLIIAKSHPGFYPNGDDVFLELFYTKEDLKVVGAEAFGKYGIDKRIDVLATAIYAGLTIDDLPNLDLAYAPPYSPAKDPVIVAGYTAQNSQNGDYTEVQVDDAKQIFESGDRVQIIDVRNPSELLNGYIDGAINLPLDNLRDELELVSKELPIYMYCQRGLRGYLATLILQHNGFKNLHNIAGGYTAWKAIN